MITLYSSYSGPEVGRALAGDVEELAYCLSELAGCFDQEDFKELADCSPDPEIVAPFLRALADQIDPQKETSNG